MAGNSNSHKVIRMAQNTTTTMKTTFKTVLVTVICLLGFAIESAAKTYVKVEVCTSLPGSCYAAVSKDPTNNPEYVLLNDDNNRHQFKLEYNETWTLKKKTVYVYFKMKEDMADNYRFIDWQMKNSSLATGGYSHKTYDQSFALEVKTNTNLLAGTAGYRYHLQAVVRQVGAFVSYDDSNIGEAKPTVSIANPDNNFTGESITVKAELPKYTDGLGAVLDNPHYSFNGWYEGTEMVSDLPEYTFTPEATKRLVAKYDFKPGFAGKGYYRIRTARNGVNEYVKLVGAVPHESAAIGSNAYTTANLVLAGYKTDAGDFAYTYDPSDPATIFWFDGTANEAAKAAKNLTFGTSFSADGVLRSQNVGTDNIFGNLEIASGAYAGSVAIRPAGASKWLSRVDADVVYGGLALNGNADINSTFELEPVTDFGAKPLDKSLYDGSYWTVMYTPFPYACSSGVEPYYLTDFAVDTEKSDPKGDYVLTYERTLVTSRDMENRIVVPANTAVVLKCSSVESAENILTPLDPSTKIEETAGNYLTGVYQLNRTTRSGDDYAKAVDYHFTANMTHSDYEQIDELKYVFRVLTAEDLPQTTGARILAEESQSCPVSFDAPVLGEDVLGNNSVYLNGSKIAADLNLDKTRMPDAFSIDNKAIPTGIVGIDGENEAVPGYYNLQGLRVEKPVTGGVYIEVKGGKSRKVIY